ncbi:ShlB/FhaC/HecB family hemolysin secretion/activation protein [Fusobacterium russii]|uniref:ShlB/FhaC/HecB family hemolysin secretion/activation protein n=1 Tax=Fusobacterium russii TaxID=854 RepID=UPI0003B6562F|nr:ShlB/FhaC/HecB family hemolysin secretion/activation protein [Fusobacterium russii]
MHNFRKVLVLKILLLMMMQKEVLAAPSGPPNPNSDAGVILKHEQEILKNEKLLKDFKEEKTKLREGIKSESPSQTQKKEEEELSFKVSTFKIDESEILSQVEIENIIRQYIGKEKKLEDLYQVVNKINGLYEEKGFIVCRAVLPSQTIKNGEIEIKLIEGKTGEVQLKGNTSTKESYIRNRITLPEGEISNFKKLNKELIWFNATNDAQIRVEMQAGKKIKTTDYILNVYEPKKNQLTIFGDNFGSKNTGEYRTGISYVNNSLTGHRDQFLISGIKTLGTQSVGLYYSFPVTKRGGHLNFQYSTGKIKIINGDLKDLEVRGKSSNYGFGFTQPLLVTEKRKIEASMDWSKQKSSTDIIGIKWVRDEISKVNFSLSMTSYGENQILYTKHNFSKGNVKFLNGKNKDFKKYSMLLMYQKAFANKTTFSTKLDAQYSFSDYLPSAEQFYAGGTYSVRGYRESFMGADKGISISNEFSMPLGNYGDTFLFFDAASFHGKNTLKKNKIYGIGLGYKKSFEKGTAISASIGFPLVKKIDNLEVDSYRLHITINHQF